MLVRELIEKLQEMDKDAVVKVWAEDYGGGAYYVADFVEQHEVAIDYRGEPVYEVIIE